MLTWKTGGRVTGPGVRIPQPPQVFEAKCFGLVAQLVRSVGLINRGSWVQVPPGPQMFNLFEHTVFNSFEQITMFNSHGERLLRIF